MASFICGYLTASFVSIEQVKDWLGHHLLPNQNKTPTAVMAQHHELPKPKFEFYTLLAKEHTAVPVRGEHKPLKTPQIATTPETLANKTPVQLPSPPVSAQAKAINKSGEKKDSFYVQIASFKVKQDAERMKASLILKDFHAVITPVKRDNITWYRVIIGPYESRMLAEKAQVAVARTENIMGMIRKMDA
ncbi:SPOR domain-containing protein [Legionella yabuuchiae]|uniref:SPOR domain-containing protein n=1 Tax=Legionella yabuuchiae TaxID=376727 RepID=UPI0013EFB84A|nr:SPOR domain-containing protein [Legionella yabuuchiae]